MLNSTHDLVDFYSMTRTEDNHNSSAEDQSEQLDILVVDDDGLVLDVISEIISASGHRARTAASAADALEMLSSARCDLVISDIRMPSMDGLKLAGCIRAEYPDVRIVLMTGYSSDSTFREAMKLDVDAYLSKPFKTADLTRILTTILDANSQKPNTA